MEEDPKPPITHPLPPPQQAHEGSPPPITFPNHFSAPSTVLGVSDAMNNPIQL